METEKQKRFIIRFVYFAIILGIAIFLCRFALPKLLPFVIAIIVALLLNPAIRFLHKKCHVHKGVASVVLVLLVYSVVIFLITILCIKLASGAKNFFIGLPATYANSIQPWLVETFDRLQAFVNKLDPQVAAAYDVVAANLTETLGSAISSLSRTVVGGVTSFTLSTPGFLLDTLIAIIATVFITVDWSLLGRFISKQLSPKTNSLIENIRTHLGRTLGQYVRSYALIMFITFCELALGLSIIGIKNQFAIAAVIALFDILPVVGSGTVLIPWAIISAITGNYLQALGLGILYVVVLIIRNIVEPKIIGEHVGLHPIITLSSMVIGTYVFGPVGLLGLPVTLALIQSLNDEGVIHLYDNSVTLVGKNKSDDSDEANGQAPNDAPLEHQEDGQSQDQEDQEASATGSSRRAQAKRHSQNRRNPGNGRGE